MTAASIGIIYGYDLSTISSALRYIADEYDFSTGGQEMVIAAGVIGQIGGAVGGGALANTIGRKYSMLLVTVVYGAFAVVGAMAVSVPVLLVARLMVGLAIGVSVVVVPVFMAECAPARMRGSVLVGYQLATILGILAGYLAAYLLAGSDSWRWMLGLAAVPSALIMSLLLLIPETARWHMLQGRVGPARQVLRCVESDADAERDLDEIASAQEEERGSVLATMLRPPYLRATVFVVGLGFFGQITGINAIVYYSPRLFAAMGLSGNFAMAILPALAQVSALAAVVASMMLVDRLGRRPILLSGIAMMVTADVALIAGFTVSSDSAAGVIGLAGVALFTAGFSFGFGSLVSVYAGESLPARMRSMGSSLMLSSNLVANAITVTVFLTLLDSLGGAGTFTVLGSLGLAALVFVYRLAPETKGRQLEDIRRVWQEPATAKSSAVGRGSARPGR
ncbi:sugar porter family MFS transporter [Mycobacterium spongiae]|uniref:Sugar porter family MFS transporter n=1 Tax=Mycobacterium spongiae TaxID=886343 RepID=A0A975K206_9MYCO|nr:sugar porter family MFS transporter [Mycobacterium spongiae]QUR69894.1 sugar porter family MFS transporter [Mycobacterium spongiae]